MNCFLKVYIDSSTETVRIALCSAAGLNAARFCANAVCANLGGYSTILYAFVSKKVFNSSE